MLENEKYAEFRSKENRHDYWKEKHADAFEALQNNVEKKALEIKQFYELQKKYGSSNGTGEGDGSNGGSGNNGSEGFDFNLTQLELMGKMAGILDNMNKDKALSGFRKIQLISLHGKNV